ncbi:MAG: AtpZ/AtpI family protein [Proteobacteria bacterium]|nr:AtpZ/AtpI family protein [Pseudomonadota bacterium]
MTKRGLYVKKDGLVMIMSVLDSKKDVVRSLISYSSLGLEMGLSVAIGVAIGYFLDSYFKTYPYLTVIFMIFGIVAALKTIYTLLKRVKRENERDNNK